MLMSWVGIFGDFSMPASSSLGLDTLLLSLLRHLVEETESQGAQILAANGAILARLPPQGPGAPGLPEEAEVARMLSGAIWSEGHRFFAPVTLGNRPVAGLVLDLPRNRAVDPERLRRLLAHAGHSGLSWSPLTDDRPPESETLPPLHVLVVEDNEVNRKVAKAFLEHAGHAVMICSDGAQAVEAVREGEFDVVLMDIRMPGMNGVDATKAIRALPDRRRAGIPILALTANFTGAEVEDYLAAGMNDVIKKPLRLGDIEKALAPLFGLPEEKPETPAEAQTAAILDANRVMLLSEALPPARLADLFSQASASIEETMAELKRRWNEDDIAAAGKSAHRLAGVAANFGCSALSDLARTIESDCKQGVSGKDHATELEDLGMRTLAALSRPLSPSASGAMPSALNFK